MNRITFAIDRASGEVVSHVGNEYAWPILDYEAIGQDGDYTAPLEYKLKRIDQFGAIMGAESLYWTKRIPTEIKNLHRAYWGMPAVKPIPNEDAQLEKYWERHSGQVFGV